MPIALPSPTGRAPRCSASAAARPMPTAPTAWRSTPTAPRTPTTRRIAASMRWAMPAIRMAAGVRCWSWIRPIPRSPLCRRTGAFMGYFLSATTLQDHSKASTDPTRHVDADRRPLHGLPRRLLRHGGHRQARRARRRAQPLDRRDQPDDLRRCRPARPRAGRGLGEAGGEFSAARMSARAPAAARRAGLSPM